MTFKEIVGTIEKKEVKMSRQSDVVGLNDWAKEFVQTALKKPALDEKGKPREIICPFSEFPLRTLARYILPNGREVEEFVQEEVWAGGPYFFLALKDEKGKPIEKSLWTKEEIAALAAILPVEDD